MDEGYTFQWDGTVVHWYYRGRKAGTWTLKQFTCQISDRNRREWIVESARPLFREFALCWSAARDFLLEEGLIDE